MKMLLCLVAATAVLAANCPAQNSIDPQEAQKAVAAAAEFLKGLRGGTNNPLSALGGKATVDFRELKALLPEELAGLRRTNAKGQKTGLMGANVAQAEGAYGEAGGPRLDVKITDLGAMGALGALAGAGWTATEVESEGDDGYERTTDYNGQRGLEKYRTATKSGSVNIMVGGRFMVEIQGTDIAPEQLKAAASGLDLGALSRLGNKPQMAE